MINHPNRSKKSESGERVIDIDIARKVLEVVDAGLVNGVGNPVPGQMCVEAAVCFAMGLPHGDDPNCVSRALRSLKIRLNDSKWSSNEARAKGLRRLALVQLGSRDAIDDREFVKRVGQLSIKLCVPRALRAVADITKDPKHREALREAASTCEREATEKSAREARSVVQEARKAAAAYADAYAYAAAYAYADADAYAAYAAAYAAYAAAYADAYAYAAAYAYADAAAYAKKRSALRAQLLDEARDKALAEFAEGVVQILIEMKAPGCQWLVLTEAA